MAYNLNLALRTKALHRRQNGTGSVEFALTALLVISVIFLSIEFWSVMYTYTVMSDAANEGLRYLMVNSNDPTGAVNKAKAYAAYSMHDVSKITVNPPVCTGVGGSCAGGSTATITVTYSYIPYTSGFMKHPPTIRAYAEGTTVYP